MSAKADLASFSQLIADIRAAAPFARFLVAGATARDLVMKFGYGIDTGRATEDIDLAFAMASWDEFQATRQLLVDSGRFVAEVKGLQRLRHTGIGKSKVDLIPFDGVENDKRQIAFPPDGVMVMNAIGFREAFDAAITVQLRKGQQVLVAPLPALTLLKLSAWKERRLTEKGKDAQDIRLVLHHYLDAGNQERLYSDAAHLFVQGDFDYEGAGAWLLGFDAQRLLRQASARAFYRALIENEVKAAAESNLLADMKSPDAAADLKLLRSFFRGFTAE